MVDSRVLTLVLFLGCILEARVPTLLTELVNRDLLTRRRILDYWNALTAFEAPDQIRSISCVSRSKWFTSLLREVRTTKSESKPEILLVEVHSTSSSCSIVVQHILLRITRRNFEFVVAWPLRSKSWVVCFFDDFCSLSCGLSEFLHQWGVTLGDLLVVYGCIHCIRCCLTLARLHRYIALLVFTIILWLWVLIEITQAWLRSLLLLNWSHGLRLSSEIIDQFGLLDDLSLRTLCLLKLRVQILLTLTVLHICVRLRARRFHFVSRTLTFAPPMWAECWLVCRRVVSDCVLILVDSSFRVCDVLGLVVLVVQLLFAFLVC